MISAKMMIPDQTKYQRFFVKTIKCKLNLKTGLNWFLKFEKQTVFKIKMFSL